MAISQTTGTKNGRAVYYCSFSGTKTNLIDNDNYYVSTSSDNASAIIAQYPLSTIPAGATITGYTVSVSRKRLNPGSSSTTSSMSYRLVTGISDGSSSYTSISPSAVNIVTTTTSGTGGEVINVTNRDENSTEIQWMNNNLSTLRNGTNFGLRLFGKWVYYYYAKIEIEYTVGTTTIYVGDSLISAAYIGTTPVSAIYVGTTKVY